MWMSKEKNREVVWATNCIPPKLTILECVINSNDSLEGFGHFGTLCWAKENHKCLQPFNYWILSVIQDSQGAILEEKADVN